MTIDGGRGERIGRWLCAHGWHKWVYPFRPVGEHGPGRECLRCFFADPKGWT